MKVNAIINSDQTTLAKCESGDMLLFAAKMMTDQCVNAIVILDKDGTLEGILTDHDIIKALTSNNGNIGNISVSQAMTSDVVTCTPEENLAGALDLMGYHKIRHLVVVDKGEVLAIMSIKDILRRLHEDEQLELNVLKDVVIAMKASSAA